MMDRQCLGMGSISAQVFQKRNRHSLDEDFSPLHFLMPRRNLHEMLPHVPGNKSIVRCAVEILWIRFDDENVIWL
jgi:hypothetical protein